MLTNLSLVALSLAATANATAAISILSPGHGAIWYKNSTVSLNWTLTDPATDNYFFRAYLSNKDSSVLEGNHSIADSTNATAEFVWILLPQVPASEGYTVNLVNTTNEAQVFASSEEFEIQDGIVASTTTSSSSTNSASSTSAGNIPNAKLTTSAPSSSNPFATDASSASSGAVFAIDLNFAGNIVHGGLMITLVCIGMGVFL
ncbi:hypothetical protein L198_04680 [Cryptococcus wingfieldii CBS 7118]|uniref:Yeast cell wall synthesis Kre9/Knh1-like N-terminal domain-containing protein n=1 Tax=Cryptococcus wingfieldii CBS 7118 TaxID=1295528 RepID=A0A1E3J361_9TREE|nr:hypothetical protein L198_04680 [Cryptococcus wingfieldii CBS 7118]ODN95289.1 hypothetical protein L198_04680 [Cryptococcus wingfieldii CBS 7118]